MTKPLSDGTNPGAEVPRSPALSPRPSMWRNLLGWLAARYRQRPLLSGFVTLLVITVLLATASTYLGPADHRRRTSSGGSREERGTAGLRFARESLRRFDEYDHWRYTEMLSDSLSQWLSQAGPAGRWLPDQFVSREGAPAMRRSLGYDSDKAQQLKNFTAEDARIIQGAAWMRDISNAVRNRLAAARPDGVVEPVALAEALFDWTMRHVALDAEETTTHELAWESLLWGRAKWQSRAWIFFELCRQQGLPGAMLAYRDPEKPGTKEKMMHRLWLAAVLIAKQDAGGKDQSDLYLFDPRLGLPLPGPGGRGVATLTQAVEQPETLRQLDTGVRTYDVKSADLKDMVVLLDGSPHLVSRRMQELEGQLRGPDKLVLTSDLGAWARRFSSVKHVTAARFWPWPVECLGRARAQEGTFMFMQRLLPFEMLGYEEKGRRNEKLEQEHLKRFQELLRLQPKEEEEKTVAESRWESGIPGFLWKGRMLQFKGIFEDPRIDDRPAKDDPNAFVRTQGAPNAYQSGRLSDNEIDKLCNELEAKLKKLPQLAEAAVQQTASEEVLLQFQRHALALQRQLARERFGRRFARALATNWIGQTAYERGDYQDAIGYFRYFRDHELKALREFDVKKLPPQLQKEFGEFHEAVIAPWLPIWDNAARDSLARSLEAAGQYEEAIDVYEQDTSPQQRLGSLIRARRLREKLSAAGAKE